MTFLCIPVPPNIIDIESSPSTVSVRENHNASLICKGEGTPLPKIKWQREDKKAIIIKRKKKEGKKGEEEEFKRDICDHCMLETVYNQLYTSFQSGVRFTAKCST